MICTAKNLFDEIPEELDEEFFQTLAMSGFTKVERIISDGQATPIGEWYDQNWDEWVLLIIGGATLRFEVDNTLLILNPGDHVMIPAGCRHRVEKTAKGKKTIWLAVHFLSPLEEHYSN